MHRRERLRSCIFAGLAAAGLATAAWPQIGPLVPPPTPPTDLTPLAGDYQGTVNGTPLGMGWTQLIPTGTGPFLRPPATHFIICVEVVTGASPPPCTVANADFLESIASPSIALNRSGSRFTFTPARGITNAELDQPLRLSVGACSALFDRSCRVIGTDVFYATRNLRRPSAGVNLTLTSDQTWVFDISADNNGSSDVGPFDGAVQAFEVLGKGSPGRTCRTDVDALDVIADMSVIAIDANGLGTPVPLLERTNGVYSGAVPIKGMFRYGSLQLARWVSATRNPSLLAGSSTTPVFIADFAIPRTAAGLSPRTFLVVSYLDTGKRVREFDERDNVSAACKTR